MERVSWMVQVVPKCNTKCPHEREAEGDLTTDEEMDTRGWSNMQGGGHQPRTVRGLRKPEKERKWILPWSFQKEPALLTP